MNNSRLKVAPLILAILFSIYAVAAAGHIFPPVACAAASPPPPGLLGQEAGGEITKSNWQQHPKIKAIRAVVRAVNQGLSRKSFKVRTRAFEYCEPYDDTRRTIATDLKGRVRFYANEAGSEDSALRWEHYYDEQGRLRFVFITGGASNGSKLEHRIYFDERGARIWEAQLYKKGPGYTFPKIWPDDQLQIKDPAGKFASQSLCPEMRVKGKR